MSQRTFLIVVDDAIIRLVIQWTIMRHDSHAVVVSAAHVVEAGSQQLSAAPQTMIADYHLQDGTGLDVLVAAQRCALPSRTVVISGDSAREPAVLAAGAVACLAKPFAPQDLLDLLRTLESACC